MIELKTLQVVKSPQHADSTQLTKCGDSQWTTEDQEVLTNYGPVLDYDALEHTHSILAARGYPPHSHLVENRMARPVKKVVSENLLPFNVHDLWTIPADSEELILFDLLDYSCSVLYRT